MRGLAPGGKRQFGVGLPLAVPHLLSLPNRLRREVDWGELQHFWWQRMAPHRAMLHRRRPLVSSPVISGSTALSPIAPIAEAPAEQAIEPVQTPDRPAPDLGSAATEGTVYHEASVAQAQRPVRAEPTAGVVGAVWRRLAAIVLPTRVLGPRRRTPGAQLDPSSISPADAHRLATSPAPPLRTVPASADESAFTPGASGIREPAVAEMVPQESRYSEPTAAETEVENQLPAAAVALPGDVPLSPADEIAPLGPIGG